MISNALSIHTQRWAAAFAERGHEVHLLTIRRKDIEGVEIHTINIGPVNSKSVIWTFLSYFYLLVTARKQIKQIDPDIVNAHYAVTHGVIGAFTNIHPLVISVWGADIVMDKGLIFSAIKTFLLKYCLPKADMVTGTSRFLVKKIKKYVKNSDKIKQVPFGVDTSVFNTPEKKKERKVMRLGFAKSLKPKYGPDILLKAFAIINKEIPCTQLSIAGTGHMKSELEQIALKLNIADKIQFRGYINKKELIEHFQSLDIFIQSSVYHSESFGVAVLEASSCGVPVVVTNVGGVPEVCIQDKTGFLVPPESPAAIADAVLKLLKDPLMRKRFGVNGRIFVIDNYNWPDCVTKMAGIFKKLKTG